MAVTSCLATSTIVAGTALRILRIPSVRGVRQLPFAVSFVRGVREVPFAALAWLLRLRVLPHQIGTMAFEPAVLDGGYVTDLLLTITFDGEEWEEAQLGKSQAFPRAQKPPNSCMLTI